MAGIGDEVSAHFFDAAQRSEIVKGHQDEVGTARIGLALHRRHYGLVPAVERDAFGIDDALLLAVSAGPADRLDQFRRAQRERHRLALAQRWSERTGAIVERNDAAVAIKGENRIRQAGDKCAQQIVAGLHIDDRLRKAILLAGRAQSNNGGSRNDGKAGHCVDNGQCSDRR